MFPTATHFSDDKMLFTVLSQTVIQDYIHLHQDAEKIKSLEFAAHLFESEDPNDSRTTRQYAVVYCEEHKVSLPEKLGFDLTNVFEGSSSVRNHAFFLDSSTERPRFQGVNHNDPPARAQGKDWLLSREECDR
jgi:hypothetical protein